MKEYKTINKKPDINKFPLEKIDLSIQGRILYLTSTPSPNKKTFILTDKNYFYVIENNNFKKPKGYILKSEIFTKKTLNGKKIEFQTDSLESQIWPNKTGNHVIIKYKNVTFYYNPYSAKKIEEIPLSFSGKNLIQPYAVLFNENEVEKENTGIFLISDFNSAIYEVQYFFSEKKVFRFRFGVILELKPKEEKKEKEDKKDKKDKKETDYKLNLFEMDKDDRITDFKMLTNDNNMIYILAITKRILFQFVGKKDFRKVFENYDVKNGDIIKAVKKFFKKSKKNGIVNKIKNGERKEITRTESEEREQWKYSRIQLIKEKNSSDFDYFGFMTDCGYITGKINKDFKPQNKLELLKYYKISLENKEKTQIVRQLMPKTVCESNFHKFFLYSDYIVVQSKLTNGIKHDEYLPYKFIDMFFEEDSNNIIIYNEEKIYKISLENEYKNLYEDYIEKGDYKTSLELKKDDKYLIPMLHKIYADHLFNKGKYLDAALEYAFSNEIFENICIKFLSVNNITGLIRYLILIIQFRMYKSVDGKNKENKEKIENPREQFIDKFLVYTWLMELIIEKNENSEDKELSEKIREISGNEKNGYNYLDSNLIYYMLNIFNKTNGLIEFSGLKKDNENTIISLLNRNKINQTLEQLELSICGDGNELDQKLKKNFYKYGNIFIKNNINGTINLLINYFKPEKADELTRILLSPDYKSLAEDEKSYKRIVDYIRDLIKKPFEILQKEINLTKDENLNNLYILLVSYSKSDNYKKILFDDLKHKIRSFTNNKKSKKRGELKDKIHFDLNFAKKIFKEKEDINSKKILCLIYYFSNQHLDSIDIALENNFEDLIFDLTKSIQETKLQKKIWLKIFQYQKEHKGLSKAKEIINKSKNMIQIEDVIPLMGDNEKLIELKDELKICIENSEKNESLLNKEINDFNESNDSIKKDIELSEKKAIKQKYTDLRCSKCNNAINKSKDAKFFLFPCRHIFDLQCLIDTYMEFSLLNLGDEKQRKDFEVKIKNINDLSAKIKYMEEQKNKALEQKQKFGYEQEFVLKQTINMLYNNLLDDKCLLCGKEKIDSTQIEFGGDDKFEWEFI